MTALPLITTSEQRAFRACQRKHHLRYVTLREAIRESASAAYFGTLGHGGMEGWYSAMLEGGDRLSRALEEMRALWSEADEPCEFTWQKASTLIVGYHLRWRDAALEVVEVEAEFRAPLINPDTGAKSRTFDLGGKIDVIVRDLETGDLLLMEHKTTSLDIGAGSDYWMRLRMDDQVSAYFDGAMALGHDVQGCLYDVLKRPGSAPRLATPEEDQKHTQPKSCGPCRDVAYAKAKAAGKKKPPVKDIPITDGCLACEPPRLYANMRSEDETPAEFGSRINASIAEDPNAYYQRGKVVRLARELQAARWDTWSTARQIREAQLSGRHVRNPGACTNYNSTCQYFPVCCGEAAIDDPHMFTDRESKHSELDGHPSEREGTAA